MQHIGVRPIIRLVLVFSALLLLISGVTFAALQSKRASLKGNRITSATAGLLISDGKGTYGSESAGFEFDNVEPGGAAMPLNGHPIYLQNSGSTDLALKVAINSSTLQNVDNAKLDKVQIMLIPQGFGSGSVQFSVLDLMMAYDSAAHKTLDAVIPAGQLAQFKVRVSMAGDVLPTSASQGITINALDLIFSGTSVPKQS